jgi:HAE1 family hydrophobic/amphiphilic exporter-1
MSANERESVDSVREAVSATKGKFPKDVKEPVIKRVDVGAVPVLIYGVSTTLSPTESKKLLDEGLIRALQKVDGVNEASLMGVGEEEVRFELNSGALQSLRIPALDVFEQISTKLSIIPWGDLNSNGKTTSIARASLPDDPKYWENQSVTLRDGRNVTLGELGEISKTRSDAFSSIYINGKDGLGLQITKRSDANTAEVVTKVEKVLKDYKLPDGIKLFEIVNQREFIIENAHEVWIALFVGGAFAVLVILLFLTDLKSALISATALPVSIAGTFIFMSWLNFSLNMMSLLALALAIGLLIDDAVVVRESIYADLEAGKTPKEAAVSGTDKVASAVLATSLAILAVFLPVGMMTGLVGQFFKQFGLTISIAVTISTWVAFTLDPMLSAHVAGKPAPFKGSFWDAWRRFLGNMERTIAVGGRWAYRHPWISLGGSIILLVISLLAVGSRGADFLAFEDRAQFVVSIRAPVGSSKAQTEAFVKEAANRLSKLDGLKESFAVVRENQDDTKASLRLVFSKKTQRATGLLQLQSEAKNLLQGLGAEFLVMDPPPIEGIAGEAPVSVFIYGTDLTELQAKAKEVKESLENTKGISLARIETSSLGDTIDITVDPVDIGSVGTSSTALELSGRLALTGLEAGSVGPDNLPFFMRFAPEDRTFDALWNGLLVPTAKGPMNINRFASFSETKRATAIDRERRSRKITIWATMDRTVTYGQVLEKVQKIVDDVKEPFSAEISGDKEMFEEMTTSFAIAIIGSFFFIFVILAIQFENLFRPFVILLSLPLAIIGGFLALYFLGQQLAMGALIGIILLIGLAAKNGILLVDAIGQKEKHLDMEAAVYESVLERTRPILMTSIAMIFGMIPTAIMRGDGSEFRAPMAYAIIGGVISSTMLSFFVVPAIFGLIQKIKNLFKKSARLSAEESVVILVLASFCITSVIQSKAFAESADVTTNVLRSLKNLGLKTADMTSVKSLVNELPQHASESYAIKSAETGAQGAAQAARLAFLGGSKVTVGREWYKPDIVQEVSIPSPLGNLGFRQVVLPKVQNIVNVGWTIPIFNLQALEGLRLAHTLQAQLPLVQRAQYESATLSYTKAWMEFEMANVFQKVQATYALNSKKRLETIAKKVRVGVATKIDLSLATTQNKVAELELERAQGEAESKRILFESLSGKKIPQDGLGTPHFPELQGKGFQSSAVEALVGAYQIQMRQVDVNDAAFYPTVSLELGYNRKFFPEAAKEGTKYLGLKGEWTILDGGLRIRGNAQGKQAALDVFAQMRELETQLKGNYATLENRKKSLENSLQHALEIVASAQQVRDQSWSAVESGLMKLIDFRETEEGLIKAQSTLVQLLFARESLKLEAIYLTGGWQEFLAK